MARYRVIYTSPAEFGCVWHNTQIIESENPISRKEIASRLDINTDSIVEIEVI